VKLLRRLLPGLALIAVGYLGYLYGIYVRGVGDATPKIVIQATDPPTIAPAPQPMPSVMQLEEAAHIYATELVTVKRDVAAVRQDLAALLEEVRVQRAKPAQVLHVITSGWQTVVERAPQRRRPAAARREPAPCRCPNS
jgi:hypothetical protein